MNILPLEKQIAAIAALTEHCSIRATERLTMPQGSQPSY
jgi:hypothetical protein